jgi:hypothetical protein
MSDDKIRAESCKGCKFNSECKPFDRIHNAYGGLECAEKWRKESLPVDDKIRAEFEKLKNENERLELLAQVADKSVIENKKYRDAIELIKRKYIDGCMPAESMYQVATEALKEGE